MQFDVVKKEIQMIKFTVPGKPFGKQRPRVTRWGTHTPEETVNYSNLVKYCFMESGQDKINDAFVTFKINSYHPIPKNTPKYKKAHMELECVPCATKPDADNIAKIVMDALNNLAYSDDSKVVGLEVYKWYSPNPRVEVEIDGSVYIFTK